MGTALRESSPLCVGIDPSAQLLAKWGLTDEPASLTAFGTAVLDAVQGLVAIVKPQSAFFERHGSAGIGALERLCADARTRGLLVLLDVKRGDIGSTSQAYAQAYLSEGAPFDVDAITATPYLGVAALKPLFDEARVSGRGVFVVARSSNPEGQRLQSALVERDGADVVAHVLSEVASVNAASAAAASAGKGASVADPLGPVGVVYGATCETSAYDLAAVRGPILAPGLGAQGATVDDIARRFGQCRRNVVPSASRSILAAGPDVAAMRAATQALAAQCRGALSGD